MIIIFYNCFFFRETEDERSLEIEQVDRNKKRIDFKEQVRKEVEERLKKEKLEQEAKRKAAEDRRAAVVERLRKKAEEEERRRLEAEAALLRIKEGELRREQEARDRLEFDRTNMLTEDEFSHLAELAFKDKEEQRRWQEAEAAKLVEFERALQAKDAEEAEMRKARMVALEAKKAKLVELKRLQGLSNGQDGQGTTNSQQSQNSTREEAAKLTKQMRIQNKAKFVTKKIHANIIAASGDVVPVSDIFPDQAGMLPTILPDNASYNPQPLPTGEAKTAVQLVVTSSCSLSEECMQFEASVAGVESEVELKKLQRELMAEKRALRLEQKQRMANHGGNSQESADIEYAKELRKKISDNTAKEGVVKKRLEHLLASAKTETSIVPAAAQNISSLQAGHVHMTSSDSNLAINVMDGLTNDQMPLYSKAEQLLREGVHILSWLSERLDGCIHSDSSVSAPPPSLGLLNKSFGKSFLFVRTDDASMQRRTTLLSMEVSQLARDIDSTRDSSNYIGQLQQLSMQLKEGLVKLTVDTTHVVSTDVGSLSKDVVNATIAPPVVAAMAQENTRRTLSSTSVTALKYVAVKSEELHTSGSASQLDRPNQSLHQPSKVSENCMATELLHSSPQAPTADVLYIRAEAVSSDGNHIRKDSVGVADSQAESNSQGDEDEMRFEDLPGWEECLTTSMASAAHHAAFFGYIEVLDCLCRYFDCFVMDKKGRTPLFYAALQNRLDCVASLVALDPQWIDVGDEKGDTTLHAASIANGVEVLSFLLQCESNPDTANYAGLTPCHLARSREALVVLCEAGAQPYCVDSKSRMPLWFACNDGRSDCVELLCEKTPTQYLLWPDDEGETCLHRAAMNGHAQCVEALCQRLPGVEDLYTVNKKQHTAAHVASSAAVLQVLYENGANLWLADPKGRMPLFTASFFGRAPCIAFLLDVASNNSSSSTSKKSLNGKAIAEGPSVISAADMQGDTALHVACLCGRLNCVSLLLYYIRSKPNKQGLAPDQLAMKAGHPQIAQLVLHIEGRKSEGLSAQEIFGCDFGMLSAITLYYGARWTKLYDASFDSVYYLDRATGHSQWERPEAYDEPMDEESRADKARAVLCEFYRQHNPLRLNALNDILAAYRGRYTELFISLANKYNVQDLSMFQGVDLD